LDQQSEDTLGDKFKAFENASKTRLDRLQPVVIRLDGKAFHTLTRTCAKPYDVNFVRSMRSATQFLCENVQGCRLAYTQSDEISLLLIAYQNEFTHAWFDYQMQKICSVAASFCAVAFNQVWQKYAPSLGYFDARAFNLPKENVNSYFVWRQNDCVRNSILSLGHANYSNKQLHKMKAVEIKELLTTKNIHWENEPSFFTHGSTFMKETYAKGETMRTRWVVDEDSPLFVEDKNYVNKLVFI
jgi:tRNA(His) guanylyltransferase